MKMPCISMHMPWAFLVMMGWKPIETRTHKRLASLVGRVFGIHATQHEDEIAYETLFWYLTREQIDLARAAFPLYRGRLICTALSVEHRLCLGADSADACIRCSPVEGVYRWGTFMKHIKPLSAPWPMQGRQGIFYADVPGSAIHPLALLEPSVSAALR